MKSVIDIANENYYLSFKDNYLVLKKDGAIVKNIHISTIASVLVHSPSITYSQKLLVELAKASIPLIICNEKHLPIAQMFYCDVKHATGKRLNLQIGVSRARANSIWKEIIKLKVREQSRLLKQVKNINYKKLELLAKKVTTGDKENIEAQAASIYFRSLFSKSFRRDKDAEDSINASLNYGYTVVRSAVARFVFASALNPSIGVFHKNNYNPFCLIDDLIEPFRVVIDALVLNNIDFITKENGLTPSVKKLLSSSLTKDTIFKNDTLILSDAINKFVYSYIDALETKAVRFKLHFPETIPYN